MANSYGQNASAQSNYAQANDFVSPPGGALDFEKEYRYLIRLKQSRKFIDRNYTYFLLREAFKGRFRWPDNWPAHKPKLTHNLIKPIVLRASALLMGKGFTWQVRPMDVSPEERQRAQGIEKILELIVKRSGGLALFMNGAQDAVKLGDAVFKTYIDPEDKWPKVSQCQPDYFYGLPASDNYMGDFAKVYYAWYIDPELARERWPDQFPKMKDELHIQQWLNPGFDLPNNQGTNWPDFGQRLRIPVLEVWTKTHYLLAVGGEVIFNGKNPYGFIPFTSIPNIRVSGQVEGQADAEQVLDINEELNQAISHRAYMVRRWGNPTLKWKGAPPNYREIINDIVGGGGAIPLRLQGDVDFLTPDSHGQEIDGFLQMLRTAGLENANTNELALTGAVRGSVNTGNSLDRQLLPISSSLEEKKRAWEPGLQRVAAQLLALTQDRSSTNDYGQALIPNRNPALAGHAAYVEPLDLTNKTVGEYRDTQVLWQDTIAGNDVAKVQTEIMKYQAGTQSLYTTLEKTGFQFPYDEIERIKEERTDSELNPATANDTIRTAAQVQQAMGQGAEGGAPGAGAGGIPGAAVPTGQGALPESPTSPTPGKGGGRKAKAGPAAPQMSIGPDGAPIIQ